uniref:Phytocyanin domain-containing protein n=1 Tax=Opuntia streptacantha TaxID=393608 RepID=A0A7C9E4J4_OPUST
MAVSSRVFSSSMVLAFALFLSFTEARDHLVGGKVDAWEVPSSEADSLNKWAEKNRFQIGDYLVWKYDSKKDSVLQVTREAYLSCNTTGPIEVHQGGETKVKLDKSGPYYFISGHQANCEKGEKLIVVVMAARGRRTGAGSPALSPALAPASELEAPAMAPTSGASGLKAGFMLVVGVLAGVGMM